MTVAALADNLVEGDETVTVTISSSGNYNGTGSATVTIADDPPAISVSRLNDGTEGGSNGTFLTVR